MPCPPPADLHDPGMQSLAGRVFTPEPKGKPDVRKITLKKKPPILSGRKRLKLQMVLPIMGKFNERAHGGSV